jgi:DNA-binding beta-propeller fold protein YncE
VQLTRLLTTPLTVRLAIAVGLVAVAVAALVGSKALSQSLPATFTTIQDVPLPGDTSRFDYESLDPGAHRLYIAHLGAGTVPVYDISAGATVGEVRDVPGVHGVLAVPELGRVYATATGTNQVAVIVPQSLSVVATTPGGVYPDGLAYDPEVGKLYVSDESGRHRHRD